MMEQSDPEELYPMEGNHAGSEEECEEEVVAYHLCARHREIGGQVEPGKKGRMRGS